MSESERNDCMLSEERLNELCQIVRGCNGLTTAEIGDVIRRFFAPPPGSVRIKFAVAKCDRGQWGYMLCGDDNTETMMLEAEGMLVGPVTTHRSYLEGYVPPVPPTPVVEVVQ